MNQARFRSVATNAGSDMSYLYATLCNVEDVVASDPSFQGLGKAGMLKILGHSGQPTKKVPKSVSAPGQVLKVKAGS